MSSMPGNPHYEPADTACFPDGGKLSEAGIINEAILALAYEQRTANLLAVLHRGVIDLTGWSKEYVDKWLQIANTVDTRLGLIKESSNE